MVRLQPRSSSSGEKQPQLTRPIALSPEDWQLILRSIHVQRQDQMFLFFSTKGPVEPAFTDDEIDYLIAKVSRVFTTAQPDERVVFALSRYATPDVTEITSGGWFVSRQSLHVVFANYRFAITMPTVRELLWQDPMWTQSGPSYDLVPVDHQEVVREEGSPHLTPHSPSNTKSCWWQSRCPPRL